MKKGTQVKMPAFDEGVIAAGTGMSLDDNPYKLGTDAHSDWQAGYLSEKDAEEATRPDGY
jgi:hypothetical protein